MLLISLTTKAQTCWEKTRIGDSVYVLQEKYDEINDTMCVIIIKEDGLDCEFLKKIKKMKHIEQDNFISKLISQGYRIEIYRKNELFY